MKHLKTLGLAAIAILALMAFILASSASADVLCKAKPNEKGECSTAAGDYPAEATFRATAQIITMSFNTTEQLTCHAELAYVLKVTAGLAGVAAEARIEALKITKCELDPFATSCTVSEGKEWTSTIAATDDLGNGTFKVKSPTSTVITCGLSKCTYTTAENGIAMSFKGGNPASLVASEVPLTFKEGLGCPGGGASPKMSGTFTATEPTNVWVATKME